MIITKKHLKRLDRGCPLFDDKDVEFEHCKEPFIIEYEVTAGATSGLEIFKANAPFKFEVLDVILQPRATVTNGAMTLKGADNITNAMTCAADTTMARATTIDDTYSTIEKGGTLEVVCAGGTVANVKGLVTIIAVEKE